MREILVLFLSLIILSDASNAKYRCSGPVTGLAIEPEFGFVVGESLAGLAWPRLCSLMQEENGVAPDLCKTIYATLLTAQITGKEVTLWFNDGGDCSSESHPPWKNLTGWYYGPRLDD